MDYTALFQKKCQTNKPAVPSHSHKKTPDKRRSLFFIVATQIQRALVALAMPMLLEESTLSEHYTTLRSLEGQIIGLEDHFKTSSRVSAHDTENKQCIVTFLRMRCSLIFKILQQELGRLQQRARFSIAMALPVAKPLPPSLLETINESPPDTDFSVDNDVCLATVDTRQLSEVDPFLVAQSRAIDHVHATLLDLQQTFSKITEMVHFQGDQIQRIDVDIENALHNVEQGHSELLVYLTSLQSSRTLIAKMTVVMVFCVIVFVLFFV